MTTQHPVDRGWAWVVCLGVAICSFYVSGPLRSYGLMFVEVNERFESSRAVAAIGLSIVSLAVAVISPVAAWLGERWGQRVVVMVGGVCTALGMFLTAFATDIYYVCAAFGILSGLGLGCIFSPSMVMIGFYFKKRRAFANGLATAGGSLGQLTIPFLFTYVLQTYAFRGGLVVFSAFLLHALVGGALLTPVSFYDRRRGRRSERDDMEAECGLEGAGDGDGKTSKQVDAELETNGKECLVGFDSDKAANKVDLDHDQNGEDELKRFADNKASKRDPEVNGNNEPAGLNSDKALFQQDKIHENPHIKSLKSTQSQSLLDIRRLKANHKHEYTSLQDLNANTPKNLHDSSVNNSCLALAPFQKPISEIPTKVEPTKQPKSFLTILSELYDFGLLRNRGYLVYAIGMCTGHMGYVCTCLFLPPFAREKGLSPYSVALMMSITGASDLVGRIVGGYVADLELLRKNNFSGLCLILTGACAVLLTLYPVTWTVMAFAVILGAFGGTYVSMMLSIVIDLVGLEKVSPGFSLAIMGSGLMAIPTPIVLGLLRDYTLTYNWSIALCGVLLAFGGAMFILSGVVKRKTQQK